MVNSTLRLVNMRCTIVAMDSSLCGGANGWLIDYLTGEDNGPGMGEPEWYQAELGYVRHDHPAELFHLGDDPAERRNRYADEPELVAEMTALLRKIQGASLARPSNLGDEQLTE